MRGLSDSHFTSPDIGILSIMARHLHILPRVTFPKLSANSSVRTSGFYVLFEVKERRAISGRPSILVRYVWKGIRLFGSRIFKVKCWSSVILKTELRWSSLLAGHHCWLVVQRGIRHHYLKLLGKWPTWRTNSFLYIYL
jgi:hypothetical protein